MSGPNYRREICWIHKDGNVLNVCLNNETHDVDVSMCDLIVDDHAYISIGDGHQWLRDDCMLNCLCTKIGDDMLIIKNSESYHYSDWGATEAFKKGIKKFVERGYTDEHLREALAMRKIEMVNEM